MDIERTLEFILEHHARFAVELDQLKDRHKELSASVERLNGAVEGLQAVAQAQQGQISRILGITEVLAESQRHTDERLNALIKVVDDLVRRNGGPR